MQSDVENHPKEAHALRALSCAELGVGAQHLTNTLSGLNICNRVLAGAWVSAASPKPALLPSLASHPIPGSVLGWMSRGNSAPEIAAKKLMFPC